MDFFKVQYYYSHLCLKHNNGVAWDLTCALSSTQKSGLATALHWKRLSGLMGPSILRFYLNSNGIFWLESERA